MTTHSTRSHPLEGLVADHVGDYPVCVSDVALVPPVGFEPTTPGLESLCSDPLSYEGKLTKEGALRAQDLNLRWQPEISTSAMRCQLHGTTFYVASTGIEPATSGSPGTSALPNELQDLEHHQVPARTEPASGPACRTLACRQADVSSMVKCPQQESNLRPLGSEPSALSTELRRH